MGTDFWRRAQLLSNLSILVWANILNTLSRHVRNLLIKLLFRVAPEARTEQGLFMSTYELMKEQLQHSLQEIEDKTRQLEESWEQLKSSRDLLQTTIDSLDGDLLVLDAQLRITRANRSARLRYSDQNIIGRRCYEITHGSKRPCRSTDCLCPVAKVRETGLPVCIVHVHKIKHAGTTKEIYAEVCASPLFDSNGKMSQVVEFIRDVTERKEQEKQILEANRALLALNTIASTVSQSLSLDVVLNSALEKAMELMRTEVGGILLIDEQSQTLSYQVQRGLSEQFVQRTRGMVLGEGIAGKVAEQGEPLFSDNASEDTRVTQRALVAEEGLRGFIGVPLRSKERVVGVLIIASRTRRSFSQQEVQLLAALGHQLGIAIENAQLYQELQLKEQMHGKLLRQIITAQEDERLRVARELHDVTSQALATLAVRVEALGSVTKSDPSDMESHLDRVKSLLTTASKDIHSLIYDLRPSLLDDLGLAAAIRSCAHSCLDPLEVEVHLEVAGLEKRLLTQQEIALFRIVQEAITNVARHARAESVYISLEFGERGVVIQVEDDGIGFDGSQIFGSARSKDSVGLLGMKERAELLGGTLTINAEPGKGTRVAIEIPINME